MNHIGLDWGTNYTSVGFLSPRNEKKPEAAKFRDNGKEKMPSLVYYSEYDTLIGEQVQVHLEQISRYPPEDRLRIQQGVVRSLKRILSPTGSHMVPGKGLVPHIDIVRDMFAYVKKDIQTVCFRDEVVDKVTLTHPVACTEAYKKLIQTAALNAGFKEVELMEEPIAAAMGYASRGIDVGRGILVYDFGGGTFDVAFVLRDDNGSFRIPIPSMGDPMCGGDDLDMRLYEYWDQKARETLGRPITGKPGEMDACFLFRCRAQKETLSRVSKMEFIEYLSPLNGASNQFDNRLSLVLDQNMLNQMFAKEINHTVDITRSMLKKIEDAGHKIDTVILIGGSSKWPLVKKLLKKALPIAPLETMDVDVAVAMGASQNIVVPEPDPDELFEKAKEFVEKEEWRQAIQFLKPLAERGRAEAEFLLGYCYFQDERIDPENMEAAKWYRKAAEQEQLNAQFALGRFYETGTAVEQDTAKALHWKAAEQGVEQDNADSIGYKKNVDVPVAMGANQNRVAPRPYPDASIEKAKELGKNKEWGQAIQLLKPVAEQGNAEAQCLLGHYSFSGNNDEAAYWYRKAAEQGDAGAMLQLGVCYYLGTGVEEDGNEALRWYKKAADRGNTDAMLRLGGCYEYGYGVKKNKNEASRWYKKAADQGSAYGIKKGQSGSGVWGFLKDFFE